MVARRKLNFDSPSPRKSPITRSMTKSISKVSLSQQELKRYRFDTQNTSTVDGHVHSLVSNLSNGASGAQRIGNKIKVLSCDYTVTNANNGATRVRLVMARGTSTPSPPALADFANYLDENVYWVIRDEVFTAGTGFATSRPVCISSHKFGSGLNIQFDSDTVLTKNLYIVVNSFNPSALNNIKVSSQVNYKEI